MEHVPNKQALSEGPAVSPNGPLQGALDNGATPKWTKTKGCIKHVAERAWQILTKSFWEAFFERVLPK
jgi:hypothetical protein